ncbi:MAG: biotin--[acetyl-CoA-carboxylase] ligase, partial [Endozoicomonas sp.]
MEQLLKLLADGGFHSGEALGNALGVSRAAVWKKLKALEELGLQLDSVRGKGYRLHPGIELLDWQVILDGLEPAVKDQVEVDICLQTASTMDRVRELSASRYRQLSAASPQSGHGHMLSNKKLSNKKLSNKKLSSKKVFCVTEYQSCGRGRRGRTWSNPFGSTICLSLRWPFSEGMASLEGLSLAAGLAVLQALEACGADGLKLKWPNDVLWEVHDGFRKLSGILLEVYGDPTGDCEVVIGVGVNIALSQQ